MKIAATSDNRPGIRLSLRAGEKIYINGAVLKADRKVSLELLNDATFLLENHVLQADQTTTPLRQLYFAVQMVLINPALGDKARETAHAMLKRMFLAFSDPDVLTGLKNVDIALHEARFFEALKIIRGLYALEGELLPVKSEAGAAHEATLKGALA